MDIKEIKTKGYERVVRGCHEKSNFNAFIAIHTLKNGPAFGGIRYFNYRNNERACLDVKKLAEAMTEKCMVAGIDLSGGKTAIQKTFYKNNKAFKVEQKNFYPCLGELINYLNGDYYGGLDVGFDYTMLQKLTNYTDFTTKYSNPDIGSLCTALGVYNAIKAAVKSKLKKDSVKDLKIAVKGVGKVGYQLINYLLEDGAKLIIADKNLDKIKFPDKLQISSSHEIKKIRHDEIHKEEVDIYSPCALGNDIRLSRIKELKCKIICGAANNQLDITDPEEANRQLVANDILYIPDTLANAGGVFRSAGIILKTRDEQDSFKLIKTFYDRTLAIINIAEENKISPADVCKHIGQGITGKPNKFKIMLDNLKH